MSIYLTALGIACSLGFGKEAVAKALFNGENSFQTSYDLISNKKVPVKTAPFELPLLPKELHKYCSRNNRLLKLTLDEIRDAIDEACCKYGRDRVGVVMATSTSGTYEQELAHAHYLSTGKTKADYNDLQAEISSPSLFAAEYLNIKGPAYTISTACSSGGKALCAAKRLITSGICDAVIVGGVDTLCGLTLNGFDALGLVSSEVCKPLCASREGITIGEGAACFLATREGTAFDITLSGYGESSDAYHISHPHPEGKGAIAAIQAALNSAAIKPEEIVYINLHGTGTIANDVMESISVNTLFGDTVPCSSTKALTGHTLGAAGAIEAAFLYLALQSEKEGKISLPPHISEGDVDATLPPLHLVDKGMTAAPINGLYALMSNSFAFGGSNVSIILSKVAKPHFSLTDVVPHTPPMVLLDEVISYRENSIHCRVTIGEHSPFCSDGTVPNYVGIEYMAQGIAAWMGCISKERGKAPRQGYLIGCRQLDMKVDGFNVGVTLDVYGKLQYMAEEMGAFDCAIEIDGDSVIVGRLNVFQPKEGKEPDE